jgi:hypothetical protein
MQLTRLGKTTLAQPAWHRSAFGNIHVQSIGVDPLPHAMINQDYTSDCFVPIIGGVIT